MQAEADPLEADPLSSLLRPKAEPACSIPRMPDEDVTQAIAHGRLARVDQQHDHELARVDLHSLLIEVSHRITSGEGADASPSLLLAGDAVVEQLSQVLDVHENRFGRARHRDLFWLFHHLLNEPKPPVEGAAYLELGCGSVNPLALGLVFVAAGAASYTAVDIEEVQDAARAARGMARLVDTLLADPRNVLQDFPISRDQIVANLHDVDVAALREGNLGGAGPRLQFVRTPANLLPPAAASIDVVLSNSFLEHVEDVDSVLAEISRVTSAGGFGIHQIDGLDHRSYSTMGVGPHDFLRDPPAPIAHGSNRIRVLEFPDHFARHGFAVQQVLSRQIEIGDDEIDMFSEPWRSMPRHILETVQATMVVRRT